MLNIEPQQSVREIALEMPDSVRVFETLHIDYCCGGKHSLSTACVQANVPLERVMQLLASASAVSNDDLREWNRAPLSELTHFIVDRHHSFVRAETPRIQTILAKVVSKHGSTNTTLPEREEMFSSIGQELAVHMAKEEAVLFPYIDALERAEGEGRARPAVWFGSIETPILNMTADHELAGNALARLRALSNGYRAPDNACPTVRGLYRALEGFEQDLHRHVHLENNILFPRALEVERNLEPVRS